MAAISEKILNTVENSTDQSVSAQHPDYEENYGTWVKCRDVISGTEAVKAKGEEYLPKMSGQSKENYSSYKDRAVFYPAVKRTIKGMAGMVFMKDVTVEKLPESLKYLQDDITLTGTPLFGFAKDTFHEIMGIGRGGILVDHTEQGAPEQRPYLTFYEAEQIINWRPERKQGKMVTTLVVLYETYDDVDPNDKFVISQGEQYRVLELLYEDEDTFQAFATPRYRHRVYRLREVDDPDHPGRKIRVFYVHQEFWPVRNGKNLDFIPFVPMGSESISWDVQAPPTEDMADMVLSHYRSSADLENGRHWCGIPQPYLSGFPDKGEYKIGGDEIWISTDPQAKAGMLEFTGQGLQPLENALKEKEDKLAVLGMRLLESQKRTAEQPEALRLRMLSDVSTLQSVVRTISQGITKALNMAIWWASASGQEATVTLNLDYDETILQSQDLTALVTLWQSEGISYKTLYHNLQKGEIAREGIDFEQELKDIQEEKEEAEKLNREVHPELYDENGNPIVQPPNPDDNPNPGNPADDDQGE